MTSLSSRLRNSTISATRLLRDRRGNVAIIFALGMPVVAAGAAFSVETSYDYYKHQRLQASADAAAYSGAIEVLNGSDSATVTTVATNAATQNGWSNTGGATITVNTPPASGPNQVNQAVEVILTQNEPRFFTALFTDGQVPMHRRAVALYQQAANACIVALSKTASRAVDVTGSAAMNLVGCDVASNSNASDAIHTWGSANVSADCAFAVGQIANNGAMTLTVCPGGEGGQQAVPDPFSTLTPPTAGPCINTSVYKDTSLSPGTYCSGISLKGTDTLAAGTYYVSGGNFTINSNAAVSGSGVTIYLSGSARVSMNGNSDVQLTAPTTGSYSGILFFGDRGDNGTTTNTFNGDTASRLTGNLYFPSQSVAYNGNFSGQNGCTYVVANTVSWSGSATFSVDCTNQGMKKIPARNLVKLVE